MAHIVLAWELGGGLGHLKRLQALAKELLAAGHQLTLVSRDIENTRRIFAEWPVALIPSPLHPDTFPEALEQTPAYAHILFNIGYGRPDILNEMVVRWHRLLESLAPDMLIADHAPTALMVSRDMAIPRINYGDGFTCPPPSDPLPLLYPTGAEAGFDREDICLDDARTSEQQMLEHCNQALALCNCSAMEKLGDIYRVDETFLMTVPALDHLGSRTQVSYSGLLPADDTGLVPHWPRGSDHRNHSRLRIFVYLKMQDYTETLLDTLSSSGLSVLVYIGGLPVSLEHKYQQSETLAFAEGALSIPRVLSQSDLVVSHGGHQLSSQCLMNGVPQMHLPINLEQQLLAARCEQTGASLTGTPDAFQKLLTKARERLPHLQYQAWEQSALLASFLNPLGRCMALIEYHLSRRVQLHPQAVESADTAEGSAKASGFMLIRTPAELG